ncbi:MAG: nucleotidyltransferase domain-containing protein [Candidatus Omnitrophota bacterium]
MKNKITLNTNMFLNKRKKILLTELKRIKGELIVKYHPRKIILFGSLLKNRVKNNSDIDLVIIKDTNKAFIDRAIEVALLTHPNFAVDFLVYTPEEYKQMSLENNYFFNEISKGRVIYAA